MAEPDALAEFSTHRGRLFGIAYRMLGSAADAEDIVQEAYLRWSRADDVAAPGAWLAKTVTNLCLNHLSSARARREQYVGPWLPEPVCTEDGTLGPLDDVEQRESVSLAMLVLLERLSPTERAAFVLREAFGYDHASIADVLDCSLANSRQLHRRATQRLRESRPRFATDDGAAHRLAARFIAAARDGDLPRLEQLLAADVVSWSDGGGKASAARRPVYGSDRVGRLVVGLFRKAGDAVRVDVREVNGAPALVGHANGVPLTVMAPRIEDGRITALHAIVNPDKLRFISDQLDLSHSEALSGPHW